MRWCDHTALVRSQPRTGGWRDWKVRIASDCQGRCVYCAIPEARFGGIRNFHVEHFRPKSRFPKLANDIRNLYLACGICNVLKSDDWPGEPASDHSTEAYPDPARTDYNAIFRVSTKDYEVVADCVAGRYVIQRVLLNRAQLVIERRLAATLAAAEEFSAWVRGKERRMTKRELRDTVGVLLEIDAIKTGALKARPYGDADTKREPVATRARPRSK